MNIVKKTSLVLAVFALTSISVSAQMIKSPIKKELGKEYPPADEAQSIAEMTSSLEKLAVNPGGDNGKAVRQAHTNAHGVVKATFTVAPNLPKALKVGLFKKPGTYQAYVRFSNASATPKKTHDTIPDVRGMAIKLMNVPGKKILTDEINETTQDFILISFPTFSATSVKEFSDGVKALTSPDKAVQGAYFGNPANGSFLGRLAACNTVTRHLLDQKFWSTTPYKFGNKVVKYYTVPSNPAQHSVVSTKDVNYLRQNLAATLANETVSFDFMVQFQENADAQPIEDPTIEWKTKFVKIGTITFPKQTFDTPEQNAFAENLSFSPWHALPDHKPLGGINRSRKVQYEVMSKLRHKQNGEKRMEPTK